VSIRGVGSGAAIASLATRKEHPVFGIVRVYLEAAIAVATMTTLAAIGGLVAAAITGDRALVMATVGVVFVLTGFVLAFRLWRRFREPALPLASMPDVARAKE
jgi:hypothetical protein